MTEKPDLNLRFIVTGASSGIGAAIVNRLAALGSNVTGIARRHGTNHSNLVEYIQCDFSKFDQIGEALKPLSRHPSIDGVIMCHGYGDFGALEQFSEARIHQMVNTNLTSCILLARMVLPVMKKSGRGKLVFVGSESALQGARQGAVYCATKFALRGFSQALRQECSSSGVQVSIINPGMVDTPFFDHLTVEPGADPDNRLEPDDVVDGVFTILRAKSNVVIDEINLSPLKTVVHHKKTKKNL